MIIFGLRKSISFMLVVAGLFSLSSCTTDQYGNTAVTPGGAAAIGIGAAVAGAAINEAVNDNNKKKNYHHHHNHYYRPSPPPRPCYRPRPRSCR